MKTKMKNTIITASFLLLSSFSYAQEVLKVGDIIQFKTNAQHILPPEYLEIGKKSGLAMDLDKKYPILLEPNYKFRIVEITSTGYIITALLFIPLKKNDKNIKIDRSEYYNYKLFEVNKDEIQLKAELIPEEDRFSIGILTLPFKFRPQGAKSFEGEFNLNSTLNIKLWNSKCYAQLGAGIGGVDLNTSNASGVDAEENIKASALSFLAGIMIQYKKAQAGIYIGTDHINNQKHYQWENNGNLWVSIGIGYQLFDIGLGQDTKNKNKNN
ncbi:MAG TPA: hypothetical protein DCM02_12245 [Flavobacterium sp.]|nr:hypothetical protein [Flavobacterium sp.]HAT77594.1 hypothetical protein [Flavobacterium sp.]